jgi:predicted GNAT family acetyltransferase
MCALNAKCFGDADKYSRPKYVRRLHTSGQLVVLLHHVEGDIAAYYILRVGKKSVQGDRLGVSASHRKRGLGAEMAQRAITTARGMGLPFKTYTHHSNIRSANLHVRAGMKIEKLDHSFIYFRSTHAKH